MTPAIQALEDQLSRESDPRQQMLIAARLREYQHRAIHAASKRLDKLARADQKKLAKTALRRFIERAIKSSEINTKRLQKLLVAYDRRRA